MASFVSTSGQRFPAGTTVAAYKASNWIMNQLPPTGAPQGAADATTTVAADGTFTFVGLADDTAYFMYGLVSGEHRYRGFRTSPAPNAAVSDYVPQPDHHGMKAWAFDPAVADANQQLSTGVVFVSRLWVPTNITVANLLIYLDVIGATLTAGQSIVGLYSSGGTLLGKSADQSAVFAGTVGVKTAALTAEAGQSLALTGGDDVSVLAAVLSVGTTMPRFKTGSTDAAMANVNRSAANLRYGTVGSALTALPASITPASLVAGRSIWMGLT